MHQGKLLVFQVMRIDLVIVKSGDQVHISKACPKACPLGENSIDRYCMFSMPYQIFTFDSIF